MDIVIRCPSAITNMLEINEQTESLSKEIEDVNKVEPNENIGTGRYKN